MVRLLKEAQRPCGMLHETSSGPTLMAHQADRSSGDVAPNGFVSERVADLVQR